MDVVFQLAVNALITAAIYALAASGLTFIYATTRIFHLAHGAVVALGAFLFWYTGFKLGLPFALAALLTCMGCAIVGVLMNELIYEPLRRRKAKGFAMLVATIAMLTLGNAALLAIFGSGPKSANLHPAIWTFGSVNITSVQTAAIITSAVLLAALALFIRSTKFGQAMRATADNEMVASILGINPAFIRRLTFIIGSALGGVAGIFLFLELNADPNMGLMIAIRAFTAIVIGGAGSMEGAISGSMLLASVEQGGSWFLGAAWKDSVGFVMLFLFVLIRPSGIFGKKNFA